MKITLTFELDWPDYIDVSDELLVEDMLDNWAGKEGVTLLQWQIERNCEVAHDTILNKRDNYNEIAG